MLFVQNLVKIGNKLKEYKNMKCKQYVLQWDMCLAYFSSERYFHLYLRWTELGGERVEKRTYKTIENNGWSEKLTRTFKSGELKTHTKIIYKYIYYKGQTIPGRQLVFVSIFMEKIYIWHNFLINARLLDILNIWS